MSLNSGKEGRGRHQGYPITDSDPYSAELRKRMIEHRYRDEDVEAWIMPDIEGISYGRKVGW